MKRIGLFLLAVVMMAGTSGFSLWRDNNSAKSLSGLIGKSIRSSEIQSWMNNAGTPDIVDLQGLSHYIYVPLGISMNFDGSGILKNIYLYPEVKFSRQFKGALPKGITFLLKRKEVDAILGTPEVRGEYPMARAHYDNYGIAISYSRPFPHEEAPDSTILVIEIRSSIP